VPTMTRSIPLLAAAALALALLAGCSDDPKTSAAAPTPTSAATSSAPATAATQPNADQFAQQACQANAAAQNATKSDDPTVMRPVAVAAQKSSNESIARAGLFLSRQVDRAQAAKGASDEVTVATQLSTGSFEFSTACVKAGLVY
jgi:membrane-bound lytic murein transglycosylase B